MTAAAWPFPGEGPLQRARRLLQAYRARLSALDPAACTDLDEMASSFGETWVTPRVLTVDLDDVLTPAQAADLACVEVGTIRQWRHRSRLEGHQNSAGEWRYVARDVLAAMSPTARRLAIPPVPAA